MAHALQRPAISEHYGAMGDWKRVASLALAGLAALGVACGCSSSETTSKKRGTLMRA